ncbi:MULTISPECIES: sulfurtransferase complex subunit TusD [Oceanimonas]|uniref:Sulfurtransferase complex subunit TusD n=1 Tax=Oceanimonas smirnovii TaxID=264574 RepID=A0ABW7P2U0_9GAMM|nr:MULTISPECIES: sulfurtransferase complex subunit TusD [Oceanimonas]MDV2858923.1 sulfurtransferase complex subunit TusD [Oceanimonas sp. CAM02]
MTPASLRFALLITGPCYGSQAAADALRFASAVLEQGHVLDSVFFYQEGVHNGSRLVQPASDEFDVHRAWVTLAERHQLTLDLCVAAALRRGLCDDSCAAEAGLGTGNVAAPFRLSGLGALAQAALTADRVVQF